MKPIERFALQSHDGPSHSRLGFGASDTWTVTLRDWSVPYLRPRISLKRQPISASD